MNRVKQVLLIILVLLGGAAGIAKMMQTPQEVAFFQATGLSNTVLVIFGAVQLLAALMLIFKPSRMVGAVFLIITFGLSAAMIFKSGQTMFGLIALLPILLTIYVARSRP